MQLFNGKNNREFNGNAIENKRDKYDPGCSAQVGVKGEAASHTHRRRTRNEFTRRLSTRTRRHIHRAWTYWGDIFVIYPTVEGESIVKMAGEKRTQDQEETLLSETVILIDIEGTTTSISFVKVTKTMAVRQNAPYSSRISPVLQHILWHYLMIKIFHTANISQRNFRMLSWSYCTKKNLWIIVSRVLYVCVLSQHLLCRLKSSFRFPVRETASFMAGNRCFRLI